MPRPAKGVSASGFGPKSETSMDAPQARPCGSSETDLARSARAALQRIARRRACTQRTPRKQIPTQPTRGRHPSEILIADVLAIYLNDVAPVTRARIETKQRVLTLDVLVGGPDADRLNGANCRAYVEHRAALRSTLKAVALNRTKQGGSSSVTAAGPRRT